MDEKISLQIWFSMFAILAQTAHGFITSTGYAIVSLIFAVALWKEDNKKK